MQAHISLAKLVILLTSYKVNPLTLIVRYIGHHENKRTRMEENNAQKKNILTFKGLICIFILLDERVSYCSSNSDDQLARLWSS